MMAIRGYVVGGPDDTSVGSFERCVRAVYGVQENLKSDIHVSIGEHMVNELSAIETK